ncbi:30S ribosomal protein S16 [Emticicia oligotrophica DSM 17448]|uniref:Small ribosomal subunit protein bS16 n=2 Tax=Emticicia TaxID=312278 RepID=A0ABM5N7D0_EMTOG|nr:30S ribosomal protein S16 [Emticicia oligotrophica DSM 17448]
MFDFQGNSNTFAVQIKTGTSSPALNLKEQMAVKIRLARRGRKQAPIYDIVVADSRSPRDGKFIEKLGQYNPQSTPAGITLKDDRAVYWLMVGAEPTDTTKKILSVRGVMLKKHLQVGVAKGAITQEVADARFEAWAKEKDAKREAKIAKLTEGKDAAKKAAFEAEKKKRADMEAAQQKAAEEAAAAATATEETTEEAPAAEASEETTEA